MEFLKVLALAFIPGLGNFVGAVLGELAPAGGRVLSYALHLAGGVVFGVVGVELLPRALDAHTPWVVVLTFVLGGFFAIGVDKLSETLSSRAGATGGSGPWAIWSLTAVDLFTDGILVGTGSAINLGLGLLLAVAQVPADIPEGFSTLASFREAGALRRRRLALAGALILPTVLGATVGYWAVRDRPLIWQLALLAFAAGVLLTLVVEEVLQEAHRAEKEHQAGQTVALIGGFALFALLSLYLG